MQGQRETLEVPAEYPLEKVFGRGGSNLKELSARWDHMLICTAGCALPADLERSVDSAGRELVLTCEAGLSPSKGLLLA